ncbi:MAG TPA: tetratricopeptide repeat protein [bacterium]|nr:tetratricopeptide repeat protein [bacterium]HPQ66838.1 tetratricopeptide repeat protein [bacterium]
MNSRYPIVTVLIAATLLVFGPAWRYDFVGWDDDIHVYNNSCLKAPAFSNVLHFWKGPHEGLYMPVTFSLWALLTACSQPVSAEAGGTSFNPHIFHAANIILHILNVLLVFAILNRLFSDGAVSREQDRRRLLRPSGGRRGRSAGGQAFSLPRCVAAAAVGAALYAVHPLQVEPVAWVSSMKDLLCGFFSLLALRSYLLYAERAATAERTASRDRRGLIRYGLLATGAFALALLSKPAAVSVPFIAGLLLHFRYTDSEPGLGGNTPRTLFRQPRLLLIGWILISVPVVFMARFAERGIPLGFVATIPGRVLIAGDALGFYLFKLFVPLNLGIDYGRLPRLAVDGAWGYFPWIMLSAVAGAAALDKRRRQWLTALGIFAVGAAPTLGLVPHGFQVFSTVADRFLYLAMLGPALALGWAVMSFRSPAVGRAGLIVVCLLGLLSIRQRRYWTGSDALFRHALEINDRSFMAYYNLGRTLDGEAKPEEAIFHYEKALDVKPDYGRAHNNLGAALTRTGRLREAIPHFAEALRLEPGNGGAYYNLYVAHNVLGVELAEKGNRAEAVKHFAEALRLNPGYAEARRNLDIALRETEKSGGGNLPSDGSDCGTE